VVVGYISPVRPLTFSFNGAYVDPQVGKILPGYDLVNGRVDLRNIGGRNIDFGLWVRNALGKTYISAPVVLVSGFPISSGNYGEPRTYGVDLRNRWGG